MHLPFFLIPLANAETFFSLVGPPPSHALSRISLTATPSLPQTGRPESLAFPLVRGFRLFWCMQSKAANL